MPNNDGTVLMEGVTIIFRNFAGKAGMYNAEGDRNFHVLLDPKTAAAMEADGWDVKYLKPRDEAEEGDDPQAHLPVSLKYRGRDGKELRPPTVVMISSRGRNFLTEENVELLDWADIQKVDLIVRPYQWGPINGKYGIKAYVKSIYVTIEEDALELKYNHLDDINARSGATVDPTDEEG